MATAMFGERVQPLADAKPSECGDCSYEYACKASLAKKRAPFARTRSTKK